LLAPIVAGAEPTTVSWSGELETIQVDNPASIFSGITPLGTPASASMTYDDDCPGSACTSSGSPTQTTYVFEQMTSSLEFVSTIVHGQADPADSSYTISIANDQPLNTFFATALSEIAGTEIPVGTLVDSWTIGSREPALGLPSNVSFGVAFTSLDTSLYSNTDFRAPPAAEDVDLVVFFVAEGFEVSFNLYWGLGAASTAGGDDADGDGVLDAQDNCPLFANPGQAGGDAGGRGAACLCGDQNGDGTVDIADILAANGAIFNPALATPLCDANDDGACDVSDILGINAEIFSPEESAVCSEQPCPDLQLSCP
jgi:hypothetical protein